VSIRTKIVVPFLLLFGVEFAVVALLSASIAARSVERSIRRESQNLAEVLGQAGFAPDRDLLLKIKKIIRRDVARLGPGPGELISTFGPAEEKELLARFEGAGAPALQKPARAPTVGSLDVKLGEQHYRVFYSEVGGASAPDGSPLLMLLLPAEAITAAKRDLVVPILLAAGAGALPVALLGVLLAMAITRPLRDLAHAASHLAEGRLDERVDLTGTDEIAALAGNFNTMAAELKAREAEVLRSERLAVSGRLAAGVAHEIRNPLTAVRMTLQRASRDEGGELDSETAKVLLSEIERVEMIVGGLLAYARPGPPVLEEVDVCELVREVTTLMERQLEHAHVDLDCDLPEAGLTIRADAGKFKQVLMNLMLNALKAMPRGGSLGVRVTFDVGGVTLAVADNGEGVPDEVRNTLFEPFVSSRDGGTGLGLAISKQIVEEHGGEIGFESSAEGTTFRVSLPVREGM